MRTINNSIKEKFPKNKKITVRINDKILKKLQDAGYSSQNLIDYAIEQLVRIETKIKVKKS